MAKPSKQLQAEWYKKLKDSGFVDIERGDRLIDGLRYNDERHPTFFTRQAFDNQRHYYEVARQLVEQDARPLGADAPRQLANIPPATQALIRALHAEGLSNREMEKLINVSRYLIGRVVRAFVQQIREEVLGEKAEAS